MYEEGRMGLLEAIEGCTIRAHRAARLLIDGGVDDENLWDAAMEMCQAQAAGLEYLGFPADDIPEIGERISVCLEHGFEGVHPLPMVRILHVGVTRIIVPAYRVGTTDAPEGVSEAILRFAEVVREEAVASLSLLLTPHGYDVVEGDDGISFPKRR